MPGFYLEDEYDLAGFSVGIVDKEKIINSDNINVGDKLIGIKSSGLHSNGFSLVRKVFNVNRANLEEYIEELGMTLGECLLTPTKIYVKPVISLLEEVQVKGISNITGGGFYENLPRMLREGVSLNINKDSYEIPEIFKLIQRKGEIPNRDMYNTFNMGIGMCIVVSDQDAEKAIDIIAGYGEEACLLGEVVDGNREINII